MHSGRNSLEDLILDSNFIRWVKSPSTEDGSVWITWAAQSQENQNILNEARELILEISADDDAPLKEELAELWDRISASNREFEQKKRPVVTSRLRSLVSSWQQMAAVIVASLVVSTFLLFLLNRDTEHHTEYAKTKKIVLPDGSFVVLNANSSISYSPDWDSKKPREVILSGEAYFSVTHKKNSQKFIVHTRDLDIQVLGTTFDVKTRRGKTRVILLSGKVKLFLAKQEKAAVEMVPDQLVDFSVAAKQLSRKTVNAAKYSSWVDQKLIFEETSLSEIAQVLEDSYGYKVKFSDNELGKLTFTGTIDSGNVDLLLTILQKTFNISILKKEGSITINNK